MTVETEENILEMMEINKLLDYHFFIPSYQRGYRWTKKQVKALLDDIWDFRNGNPKVDDYYCLQPIVVTLKGNGEVPQWELIDGQQRLTTIFIILNFFNSRYTEENRSQIFSLEYETRIDSRNYLKNIKSGDKDRNIDYHFIHEAFETVKEWFKSRSSLINDFESILLNKTKVIWYEVKDPTTNPIDIFTRINIGKIPLTNSELIKALFLQKENFKGDVDLKQLRIAAEWDDIEKKLQDDSFWYFIYSAKHGVTYENRIEYIFDLMHNKTKDCEEYFTFNQFNEKFEEAKSVQDGRIPVEDLWLKVKRYFLNLEEWYNDRQLYHLIGFLIEHGGKINKLIGEAGKLSKTCFVDFLKQEIRELLKSVQIELLEHPRDRSAIKMTLLLFNIQTILATQKAELRYPFDKYKNENWDIEHVNSQTERNVEKSTRKEWASDILEYYTGVSGCSDIISGANGASERDVLDDLISALDARKAGFCNRLLKVLDSEKVDDEFFEKLYDDLLAEFKEKGLEKNDSIANLALLDEATNRGYKNAMFPIKRKRIIENDSRGIFVPIATKNLFLKYYSKKMGDVMYWQKSDADDYLHAIKETLKDYLPTQTN